MRDLDATVEAKGLDVAKVGRQNANASLCYIRAATEIEPLKLLQSYGERGERLVSDASAIGNVKLTKLPQ